MTIIDQLSYIMYLRTMDQNKKKLQTIFQSIYHNGKTDDLKKTDIDAIITKCNKGHYFCEVMMLFLITQKISLNRDDVKTIKFPIDSNELSIFKDKYPSVFNPELEKIIGDVMLPLTKIKKYLQAITIKNITTDLQKFSINKSDNTIITDIDIIDSLKQLYGATQILLNYIIDQ